MENRADYFIVSPKPGVQEGSWALLKEAFISKPLAHLNVSSGPNGPLPSAQLTPSAWARLG